MIRLQSKFARVATLGAASALVVTGFVGLTETAAQAAAATYTAAPSSGPGGTATAIVSVTGTGFKSGAGTSLVYALSSGGVELSATCTAAATGSASSTVTALSVVSATKLVVTITNAALGTANAKKDYKICVFANATGHALLGSGTWTAYPAPTVSAISPAAGPSFGGQAIAIDGTGFSAASKVTIGGIPATGVKLVDSTSLTAVAPAGTGTGNKVVVTTEGGKSGNATTYDYVTAITVSPNTGPTSAATTIDILGSGFDALDFTAHAAVTFMPAAYSDHTAIVDECDNVTVVSDSEIVCDAPSGLANKSFSIVVVDDDTDDTPAYKNAVTSGSTFTAAAF